jgi:hypothetical protein
MKRAQRIVRLPHTLAGARRSSPLLPGESAEDSVAEISRGRFIPLVGLLCAVLMAPARSLAAEGVTLNLEDLSHGTYRLEGHIHVGATPYDAWKVLTDYEHMSSFVSSLRKSAVQDSTTDRLLLEQEALGKEFFITKKIRVLLQVTEVPYKKIIFEDVSHKDFAFYEGKWEILAAPEGLDIAYRLNCKRLFMVPDFIAKNALKKSAEGLLSEVRQEILHRKGGSS